MIAELAQAELAMHANLAIQYEAGEGFLVDPLQAAQNAKRRKAPPGIAHLQLTHKQECERLRALRCINVDARL